MTVKFADLTIEKRSIDYVPIAERHGKVWHLWPVWFSGDAHLATVATGVVGVALGGHLLWMALAVLFGCAFGTFFMAFHSTQGPQLGLPQMIQSRPQFGYVGALLVWGVALIAYIGFNAFNQILAAQTVLSLYGGDSTLTMLVFTILSVSLAVIGYDLIHIAQRWGAYLLIARLLPRGFGVAASFWWAYLGAFVGGTWMMLLGTLSAALYPTLEVATALRTVADSVLPGFGKPLLLCSLVGLVTITSLNYYGASLTFLSVMDSIKPSRLTVGKRLATLFAAALLATALALSSSHNFVEQFGEFLDVLLYLFTPWTAINLVDFYWIRKGHYSVREIFNPHGMYGRWNWRGLWAYGIGFVSMVPFFSTESWKGPVAKALGGADVAMLVGLPVSALVYIWACRSLDLTADRRQAYEGDIGLDPDADPAMTAGQRTDGVSAEISVATTSTGGS